MTDPKCHSCDHACVCYYLKQAQELARLEFVPAGKVEVRTTVVTCDEYKKKEKGGEEDVD